MFLFFTFIYLLGYRP